MDKFDVMDVNRRQRERIAELEAENKRLREALKTIADDKAPPSGLYDESLYWWAVDISESALKEVMSDE